MPTKRATSCADCLVATVFTKTAWINGFKQRIVALIVVNVFFLTRIRMTRRKTKEYFLLQINWEPPLESAGKGRLKRATS